MLYSPNRAKIRLLRLEKARAENPVVFIIGQKGIGKTNLVEGVFGCPTSPDGGFRAFGREILPSYSPVKRCLLEALCRLVNGLPFKRRLSLYDYFRTLGIRLRGERGRVFRGKVQQAGIVRLLGGLSSAHLAEIYAAVGENIPLTIVVNEPILQDSDVAFLSWMLVELGAVGISCFVSTRPHAANIEIIQRLIGLGAGCVALPLAPPIAEGTLGTEPVLDLSLGGPAREFQATGLLDAVRADDAYLEMMNVIDGLLSSDDDPLRLFSLGMFDLPIGMRKSIRKTFGQRDEACCQNLALSSGGRYFLVDSLACYLELSRYGSRFSAHAQTMMLRVARSHVPSSCPALFPEEIYGVLTSARRGSSSFSSRDWYPNVFSRLANSAWCLVRAEAGRMGTMDELICAVDDLDVKSAECCGDTLAGLLEVYEVTCVCGALDIGLEQARAALSAAGFSASIDLLIEHLEPYVSKCMEEAYRWCDMTLVHEIVELELAAAALGKIVAISIPYQMLDDGKNGFHEMVLEEFMKREIDTALVADDGPTVFLSYSHNDNEMADRVDVELEFHGYHVVRDTRDLKPWDSLLEFMKRARTEDCAVLLITDAYLHSESCLYELMQLMKDDDYVDRTFPIVMDNGLEPRASLFNLEYHVKIVRYWQEEEERCSKAIAGIRPENMVGVAERYRRIKYIAGSIDRFMGEFMSSRVLGTLEKGSANIDSLVDEIDVQMRDRS